MLKRCGWVRAGDFCMEYHDREWGVPVHDDRQLFEHLILDAFQAGLSWEIIRNLRKIQTAGLVNDHTTDCFRYDQLKKT